VLQPWGTDGTAAGEHSDLCDETHARLYYNDFFETTNPTKFNLTFRALRSWRVQAILLPQIHDRQISVTPEIW